MSEIKSLCHTRLVLILAICLGAVFVPMALCEEAHKLLSPDEYIPVERISPGMRGYCKSTFNGTKVSTFPVTVIGVLKGVDFGMDLILIRIDGGPIVSNGWGVVSGMSGSPVYIAGKLVGAVAYAYPFSKAPIAGVTPIRSMVESTMPQKMAAAAAVPKTINLKPVNGSIILSGKRISSVKLSTCPLDVDGAKVPQDEMLLIPVATPLMVYGMPKASLERLKKLLQPYALIPVLSPGRPANASALKAMLEPGAPIGAQLTCGDIEITAIGTLTYRKGDIVIAFGHPLLLSGETSMPLTTAYVHGVLPSQYMSIKLASPIKAVGTFTQDRAFAMAGVVGLRSKMLQLRISVGDRDRGIERTFNVSVFRHRELTVPLVDLLIALAFTNVTSEAPCGTTFVSYEISADGLPKMRRQNAFVEGKMSLFERLLGYSMPSTSELIQTLLLLEENRFERANVKSVIVRLENTSRVREAFIERVLCDKRVARPGEELKLTIHMRHAQSGWEQKEIKVRLPDVKHACTVRIGVCGGADAQRLRNRLGILQRRPNSLAQLIEELVSRERNDQLFVCLQLPNMDACVNGTVANNMPFNILEVMSAAGDDMFRVGYGELSEHVDVGCVVRGMKVLSIKIEPDYPKEVPQPSPELERARVRQVEGGLELIEQVGRLFGMWGDGEASSSGVPFELLRMRKPSRLSLQDEGDGEQTSEPEADESEQGAAKGAQGEGAQGRRDDGTFQRLPKDALKARRIEIKSQKDLMRGRCDGAFVASDGSVRIGLKAVDIADIGDGGIWQAAVSEGGTLYVCSWQSGAVYAISNGSAKRVCSLCKDGNLNCIPTALLPLVDELLIGTSPNGEIYSVKVTDGDMALPKVWLKLNCKHIWKMHSLPSGDVLIATGLPGRVFRVAKDGRLKPLTEALDEHVMALVVCGDGSIYAGTYPMGRLWRISPDGSYRLVWETKRGAISALCASSDGRVYIGTTPHGEVFRLSDDGESKLLYDTPSRHIADIILSSDGALIVSGIMPHAIYLIDADGVYGQALKLSNEFVTRLVKGANGLIGVMSISGRIVELAKASIGEYTSPVFVLPCVADWRLLKCTADIAGNAEVTVETRSGNSEAPDETWSDWENADLSGDGFVIRSPSARALQWRIRIKCDGNATNNPPRLYGAMVSFTPVNVAPTVQFVAPSPGAVLSKTVTVEWKAYDANQDELEFELYCSNDGGKTWRRIKEVKPKGEKKPDGKGANETATQKDKGQPAPQKGETGITVETPPMPEISEELVEQVTSEGAAPEQSWQQEKFEWDTTQFPDGKYILKIVASDAPSNPLNPIRTETISPSFIVDNTPPIAISPKPEGSTVAVSLLHRIFVRDETTWVARAEFKLGDRWYPLMSADGSFDSRDEELIMPVDRLPSGEGVLEVRVFDAAGNSAVFRYPYVKGEK
ncbi:MAG: hypothetical protein GDYSWBUE_000836 [Candidatus Fervidibacterota bacterium]